MPHKNTPKVDVKHFESTIGILTQELQDTTQVVRDIQSRVEKLEGLPQAPSVLSPPRCAREASAINNHALLDSLTTRLGRLEKIYLLVDFLKLERASEHILQGLTEDDRVSTCCNDLPVPGDSPDRSTKQQGATAEMSDYPFGLLEGMAQRARQVSTTVRAVDTTSANTCATLPPAGRPTDPIPTFSPTCPPTASPTPHGETNYHHEGISLLQLMLSRRARCDTLIASARSAWRAWENIGNVGSLIILGCKGCLPVGTLVQPVGRDSITLRGFGGQLLTTTTALAEVRENSGIGVVLQDANDQPSLDTRGFPIRGRVDMPGVSFCIVGYTF